MLRPEQVALELFEYKVEDLRSKRTVRGGVSAVWELYRLLSKELSLLSQEERKRLELAGRVLRQVSETQRESRQPVDAFSELVLGEDAAAGPESDGHGADTLADPETATELVALQRLAARVWRHDLDDLVQRLATALRSERDRYTARLLFAMHRNLARNAQRGNFAADVNLGDFQVFEAIPEQDDPLLSVNDVDSLADLVRETIDLVLGLTEPGGPYYGLAIDRSASLEYVQRVARAVARDPYAGSLTLLPARGPSVEGLRIALQELDKELLPAEERAAQRRALEARLKGALNHERNLREMHARDTARFVDLVDRFFERLARYLPRTVGGQSSGPQLQGGVLFAVNPALRRENVSTGSSSVTVRLRGPTRFVLDGTEVAVSGSGEGQKLYVGSRELPLREGVEVELEHRRLLVFVEGDYLHLKLEEAGRSLAVRVAEAMAVFYVLSSNRRDELLAVLRYAAGAAVGEPQELVRLAIARIADMSVRAPSRRAAIEGFIRGSARAAGISLPDNLVLGLVQRFHTAMTAAPEDLTSVLERIEQADTAVRPLGGEPLSIQAGPYNLTIRQYRQRGRNVHGTLVAMVPGQAVGTFNEYLIEPLGDGTLVCAKGDAEVAVIYLREQSVYITRA